jgi:betaine-aldehyde dehydrogenase
VTGGLDPWRRTSLPGSYTSATLIADAGKTSEVIRDEIFGPVLCVMPFDDDEEAITLAKRHALRAGGLGVDP